ncbi:unnamed protein product [Linum trigynum]|uniref:Uncharacterized protein n=1 Tax=Linum trigynum TaxID=586398 RepID=A0AAV2CW12_9ROSI
MDFLRLAEEESTMELERSGEEKKKRWEAYTVAKSGSTEDEVEEAEETGGSGIGGWGLSNPIWQIFR